jgi:hypothetical protein
VTHERKIKLRVIPPPSIGPVVTAPPILEASDHTFELSAAIAVHHCCTPKSIK